MSGIEYEPGAVVYVVIWKSISTPDPSASMHVVAGIFSTYAKAKSFVNKKKFVDAPDVYDICPVRVDKEKL